MDGGRSRKAGFVIGDDGKPMFDLSRSGEPMQDGGKAMAELGAIVALEDGVVAAAVLATVAIGGERVRFVAEVERHPDGGWIARGKTTPWGGAQPSLEAAIEDQGLREVEDYEARQGLSQARLATATESSPTRH